MDLINDYVDAPTLTGFTRRAASDLDVNQFTLSRWLPVVTIDDIEFRAPVGGAGLATVAQFRSYDSESPISDRRGIERIMGELPPISEKKFLSEYASLRLRRSQANDPVVAAIYSDAFELTRAILARFERARGEALITGQLAINENRVQQTVNFGRDAAASVAPSTLWSVSTADILGDLMTWLDAYVALNGEEPGAILTSRRVLGLMMRNEAFRQLVSTTAGTPSIVSQAGLNSTLNAYGLPSIETYDAQVSVAGAATKVLPDDRLLMLPAPTGGVPTDNALGATYVGTTLEAQEPEFNLAAGGQAGIVAGTWKSKDPVQLWTKAGAIGLPILGNANRAFVADVA